MHERSYVVVIDDKKADISAVARELEAKGLRVTRTLQALGIIGGTADPSVVSGLSEVEGVQTIRQERGVQLPPMREDIPQ
jgi:CheY-like chemotaxis protein